METTVQSWLLPTPAARRERGPRRGDDRHTVPRPHSNPVSEPGLDPNAFPASAHTSLALRTYLAIRHLVEVLVGHIDLEGADTCFKERKMQVSEKKPVFPYTDDHSAERGPPGRRVPSDSTVGTPSPAWGCGRGSKEVSRGRSRACPHPQSGC